MAQFGFTLYCEGFNPNDLIKQAIMAEEAGFDFVVISDHYHPWLPNQQHAAFAWSVLGAVAQATKKVGLATMVTAPIVRYHPVIVAQMAATMGVISNGRFTLGLGSGERLNEHVVGMGWPPITVRHQMLREAIDIILALWSGEYVFYEGKYFTVEDAKVFDLPADPINMFVAAGGKRAAKLAAETADGLCITDPSQELVDAYTAAGGEKENIWAQSVLAWGQTKEAAAQALYDNFRFSVTGWKVQAELPNPVNFASATQMVNPKDMAKGPVGPDPQAHLDKIREMLDIGVTHLALAYPGTDTAGFMDFWQKELQPVLAKHGKRPKVQPPIDSRRRDDANYRVHQHIQQEEKLPEDYDTPFSPPPDRPDVLGDTHQVTDNQTDIDPHEAYDESADAATIDQPAATIQPGESAVKAYHPRKKRPKKQ